MNNIIQEEDTQHQDPAAFVCYFTVSDILKLDPSLCVVECIEILDTFVAKCLNHPEIMTVLNKLLGECVASYKQNERAK